MSNNPEDQKLIKLAQKDKANFGVLYEKYYDSILGYVRKRIEYQEISEDLTSKVFEKAFKAIDNFQWQGVPFQAWLYRIARNVLNDYYRSVGRKPKSVSLEAIEYVAKSKDPSPDDIVVRDEDETMLYSAIAELDDEEQYLVYYKFFEGLNNVEISKLTGLSETNVGTKLYRIRQKLKKFLD